jgi:hypothetical protein
MEASKINLFTSFSERQLESNILRALNSPSRVIEIKCFDIDAETPLIKRIIKCARRRKKLVVVNNRYWS